MKRAALVLVTLLPAVAYAQSAQDKADAEVLFNAGKAALAAGNFAEACPKLAESQRRDPAIGTSLYLAECFERSGKVASAWAEFRQAEDMARQRSDSRASLAHARADKLSPSKLVIVLAPGADAPGLEIRRDGELISTTQLGLPSPIDGGHHTIVAKAPGRHRFEWTGDVPTEKGLITVTVPKLDEALQPPTTPETPPPVTTTTVSAPPVTTTVTTPVEQPSRGLGGGKITGLIIAGAGVAAIGAGTAMGLVAKSQNDSTSNVCDSNGNCITQQGVDTRNGAKSLADWSTGVFIGGCVAVVGGLVVFFVMPRPKSTAARLEITPLLGAGTGGAMLSGRF